MKIAQGRASKFFEMFAKFCFIVVFYYACYNIGTTIGNKLSNYTSVIDIGIPVQIEEAPWQVSIHYYGNLICSGSILSKNYVLTAASCTDGKETKNITVHSGSHLAYGGDNNHVSTVQQHPEYEKQNQILDVAILTLASPLEFSNSTTPVVLRKKEVEFEEAVVTRWEHSFVILREEQNGTPLVLKKWDVHISSYSYCKQIHVPMRNISNMICTEPVKSMGFCREGSGTALTISGQQVGLLSWMDFGQGCGSDYPTIYMEMKDYDVRNFINSATNSEAQWV